MSMNCLLPDSCIGVTIWSPHPCGGYYMVEAWCYGPHGRIGYWIDVSGKPEAMAQLTDQNKGLMAENRALRDEAHQLRDLVLSLGMNHDQYATLCKIPSYVLREIKAKCADLGLPPWAEHMETQTMSDGVTVWVNNTVGAIGRFGSRGIDVHTEDTTGCLYCTHGYTRSQDWDTFVEKMLEHHGVVVDQRHKPVRFS